MNKLQNRFVNDLTTDELCQLIRDIYYGLEPACGHATRIHNYSEALALHLDKDNAEALAEELVLRCRLTCI